MASSIPATSAKVTVCSEGSTRCARERPNPVSPPPIPPPARRINDTNNNTSRITGPKVKSSVTSTEVPVDGAVALITTPFFCSSAISALLLANSGISVVNSDAGVALPFG